MTREGREGLRAAADLIEAGWTQGAFARGNQEQPVAVMSDEAKCFCLRGALVRVGAIHSTLDSNSTVAPLGFKTAEAMVAWNDHPRRTQAEVVAALRTAASLQEDEVGRG